MAWKSKILVTMEFKQGQSNESNKSADPLWDLRTLILRSVPCANLQFTSPKSTLAGSHIQARDSITPLYKSKTLRLRRNPALVHTPSRDHFLVLAFQPNPATPSVLCSPMGAYWGPSLKSPAGPDSDKGTQVYVT